MKTNSMTLQEISHQALFWDSVMGTLVFGCLFVFSACQQREGQSSPSDKANKNQAEVPSKKTSPRSNKPIKRVIEIRSSSSPSQKGSPKIQALYVTRTLDPILEEMRERDKKWKETQGKKTNAIQKAQKDKKQRERKTKLVLRSSLPPQRRPTDLKSFKKVWHQPPVAQYYAGTCWSFCTTSFMESEIYRKNKISMKLSELSTVYWEYMAKAEDYIDSRGKSHFGQGSEANALVRAFQSHGAWPQSVYKGAKWDDGKHDHQRMARDMKTVLAMAKNNAFWEKKTVLAMIQTILDRDLGRPPAKFKYKEGAYNGKTFLAEVAHIKPDEYVSFMSTIKKPFYKKAEFKVPDNWWHDDSYHNVPLDVFYKTLKNAINNGYSLVLAIDVSEPGKDPENDVMFIPPYDIFSQNIDGLSREYRFAHGITTDDHGVHLVGWTKHAGHDWFLIKDSGRSSRRGRHKGYYFIRGDYIRLKVLAFLVHKDAAKSVLAKFPR